MDDWHNLELNFIYRSSPINVEDIGVVHFRLRHPERQTSDLVRAEIQIEGPTIFISYDKAENSWPFRIENDSDYSVVLSQLVRLNHQIISSTDHKQDAGRENASQDRPLAYTVNPHASLDYAWDYPSARDKKIQLNVGSARRVVDIMEIGALIPFRFTVKPSIYLVMCFVLMIFRLSQSPELYLWMSVQTNTPKFCGSRITMPTEVSTSPANEVALFLLLVKTHR